MIIVSKKQDVVMMMSFLEKNKPVTQGWKKRWQQNKII